MNFFNDVQGIWDGSRSKDSWRLFKTEFAWDGSAGAVLEISAESTYDVLLNGKHVPVQQLSDYPQKRTYSAVPVDSFLKKGGNTIEITVHWNGESFSTCIAGNPYLMAAIRSGEKYVVRTGADWLCADDLPFVSGVCCKVTCQLAYSFTYDARTMPKAWKNAVVVPRAEIGKEMNLRSVPVLNELAPIPSTIAHTGVLKRTASEGTAAELCMTDWLAPKLEENLFIEKAIPEGGPSYLFAPSKKSVLTPESSLTFAALGKFKDADGYYAVLDAGHEETGYLYLKLAAAAGTVVDISYGEHLDDGRVRASVGGRNFAFRYICKEGLQEFSYPHLRLGGRYIELHITQTNGKPVRLCYAGFAPVELPLPKAALFRSEDSTLEKGWNLSARTLQICMHEHYEDTPWREQSLYAYDSRNQMLYGYYVWGNYDFAANSLSLLGESFDGRYLALTAPGEAPITIPVFTMVWVSALLEHYLYSGSDALLRKWKPTVDAILKTALENESPVCKGVYSPGHAKHIWNFCEWNGVLPSVEEEPQAPYNFYLCEALRSAAEISRLLQQPEQAELYGKTANALALRLTQVFRDSKTALFRTTLNNDEIYDHIQALALNEKGMNLAEHAGTFEALLNTKTIPAEISCFRFFMDALMSGTEETRRFLFKTLRGKLIPMITSGTTSLWETFLGGDDFGFAGSLSHAWSAIVPYWTGRYLLGVRPLTGGFEDFEVKPWCSSRTHLAGEIPTPRGMIQVSWKLNNGKVDLTVRHPAGTMAEIANYPEFPLGEVCDEVY